MLRIIGLGYCLKPRLIEVNIKSKSRFDSQGAHNFKTDTIDKAEVPDLLSAEFVF